MFDLIRILTTQRYKNVALLFKKHNINLPVTPVTVYDCYQLDNSFKNDIDNLLNANATGESPKKVNFFSRIKNAIGSDTTKQLADSSTIVDASNYTHVLLFVGLVSVFILVALVIITRKKQ